MRRALVLLGTAALIVTIAVGSLMARSSGTPPRGDEGDGARGDRAAPRD